MAINIKQEEINILDSRFRKNDNKKESSLDDTPSVSSLSGDTPSLSSLGEGRSPETRGSTPSLSSLGKSRRDATRGSINNEYNTLDSRVFANATHKNDRKRNADAVHKDDSQVCESDCTTPLSFLRKRESSVHKHFMPQAFRNAQSGRSMVKCSALWRLSGCYLLVLSADTLTAWINIGRIRL